MRSIRFQAMRKFDAVVVGASGLLRRPGRLGVFMRRFDAVVVGASGVTAPARPVGCVHA
ncbi:MAG: hypothetical protein OXG81_07460 [Acidobacteria bacterium]|nr:hypothetical protein [Acidobacteriota bacterium]